MIIGMVNLFVLAIYILNLVGRFKTISKLGYNGFYSLLPYVDVFLIVNKSFAKITIYWSYVAFTLVSSFLTIVSLSSSNFHLFMTLSIINLIILLIVAVIRVKIFYAASSYFIDEETKIHLNSGIVAFLSFFRLHQIYIGFSKSVYVSSISGELKNVYNLEDSIIAQPYNQKNSNEISDLNVKKQLNYALFMSLIFIIISMFLAYLIFCIILGVVIAILLLL